MSHRSQEQTLKPTDTGPGVNSSSEYCMMQKELNPHSQVFTPGISRTELTASASLNPDTEDMELIIIDNQDPAHII